MARGRQSSRPTRSRAKGRLGRSGVGRHHPIPTPRPIDLDVEWEDFVYDVKADLQLALTAAGSKRPPLEQPTAVLKRKVYEFGRDYVGRRSALPTAIENSRVNVENAKYRHNPDDFEPIRAIRKPFKDNEFHWIFLGLKSAFTLKHRGPKVDFSLATHEISRFAGQLQKACEHQVPPEYLIGFLYQTGLCTRERGKSRKRTKQTPPVTSE